MQIFFQKDLLTLTYSHFLFYAWLGISASWERPPFVELREPETQLKEIKRGETKYEKWNSIHCVVLFYN